MKPTVRSDTLRCLHVADELPLPLGIATETLGILGKRGSGKSNLEVALAEEMFEAGIPWVAVDPKGDWFGIRSAADGKGPGLPIPVLGGLHGDVPLEATAGRLIADLIHEQNLTCVLDVSDFSKGDRRRFLLDFAERLFTRHRRDPQVRHLFLEEAHEFLPQRVMREEAALVGAWSRIEKQGRTFGLGSTTASQRSASLNKDVLTQVEILIAFRTPAVQDRKAIEGWVEEHGAAKGMLASLPSLDAGEAWVWSPSFLKLFERVRFRRRRTFDSGATPEFGAKRRRVATVADVDLAALKEAMAETIERARDDDPKLLRARIKELERRLKSSEAHVCASGYDPGWHDLANRAFNGVDAALASLTELTDAMESAQPSLPAPTTSPEPQRRSAPQREEGRDEIPQIGRAERAIVTALATYGTRTKKQVALMTGYALNGGGFNNALSRLRTLGLIEGSATLTLTSDGQRLPIRGEELPSPGRPLRVWWQQRLGLAERKIMDELANAPRSKAALADATGYAASGGGFNNALSRLRTLELISGRDLLVLADELRNP